MEIEALRGPCWLKSLQVAHELLTSKMCPVFVGMILVAAISITVAIVIFGFEPEAAIAVDIYDRRSPREVEVMMSFTIFVVLIFAAVGLKMVFLYVTPRGQFGTDAKHTYIGGLAMMPAWGWKAFVVLCTLHSIGKHPQSWEVSLMVLGLAVASVIFQIGLEFLAQYVPESSFMGQMIVTTRTSFALGLGYALNLFIRCCMKTQARNLWIFWPTRLLYTVLVSVLMCWLEHKSGDALEEVRAKWHPVVIRTFDFIVFSTRFVVAWAWKGFLDLVIVANLSGYTSSPCHDQLIVSTLETLVFITAVIVSRWKDVSRELSMLVCGLCIAWCWAEVWLKCFYGKGLRRDLGTLWIAAVIVIISACTLTFVLDLGFRKAEKEVADIGEGKPLFGGRRDTA